MVEGSAVLRTSLEGLKIFEDGNFFVLSYTLDPIMLVEKVHKVNRWSLKQDRILVISANALLLFSKKKGKY